MSVDDKKVRVARSRLGTVTRFGTPDEAVDARRVLAEAKIARYVREVLATAPELSEDQLDRLSALLHPAD
ncbi:hypothetical protein ABLI39_03920 [Pseudarthrobacter sp. B907]|uniref:hypothetical protein n=1 Tax=Pseudarthrobacter sp. B907 TaxID=3158261 RepID=UPI0032DA48E0